MVALCLAITSGQFYSFEFKAYICPTIYFRPARDSPMQAPSQVLFTKCPMSSPSQNSIRKGLNLPSFPEKDYYVHEPDAVSKKAYDYKSLATSIASAGGTAKWQKTCRLPPAVPSLGQNEVLPFSHIYVALVDVKHQLVLVHAGKVFARNSPGHIYYSELARVIYLGYAGCATSILRRIIWPWEHFMLQCSLSSMM